MCCLQFLCPLGIGLGVPQHRSFVLKQHGPLLQVCQRTAMASGREVNFAVTNTFFKSERASGNMRLSHQDNLTIPFKSDLSSAVI